MSISQALFAKYCQHLACSYKPSITLSQSPGSLYKPWFSGNQLLSVCIPLTLFMLVYSSIFYFYWYSKSLLLITSNLNSVTLVLIDCFCLLDEALSTIIIKFCLVFPFTFYLIKHWQSLFYFFDEHLLSSSFLVAFFIIVSLLMSTESMSWEDSKD